jgi:glycosyltransferase involved in cell wall biosynthesis
MLVAENVLTIPMNIPLGIALTELIAETQIPTIAHHHDFYWERSRFHLNGYADLIQRTFPPDLPNVRHLVINTQARHELLARTGIPAEVVPNVMDFGNSPRVNEERSQGLRRELGLGPGDIMVLQPTRMVPRKGVETTLEIVRRLGPKRCKLVVPHGLDDEGPAYHRGIAERCEASGIDLRCIHDRVTDPLESPEEMGRGGYSLWDVYHACDIVAYPSRKEGFGNAFLEAVYTRKPIVVNRYEIYVRDIEPKGFDVIPLDEGRVTGEAMDGIHAVLTDPKRRSGMVETNYRIAREWFSYDCLAERLSGWLSDASGG